MYDVPKKIVTDENMHPVAVQIEYSDWLRIEKVLGSQTIASPATDLSRHSGRLNWPVDGLEYQRKARSEWT